jgi:tetratricopeptide (TPR) repeat protein
MEWCARARAFGDFGERRMVDVNLNEQWALLEMGARRPPSATRHRQPLGGDFELNAHAATSMMSARFRGGAWEETAEQLDELVRKLLGKGAVKAALMAVPMLTRALGRLGRTQKQFEVFERARTYLTPSAHGEALALDSEFAVALAASGRFQEASEALGRLDVVRDGADWRGREALVLLASSLVAAGAADPAASMLFERARSTFQQYRLPWYEAEGLEDWAGAMLESGQQDAAREAAAEALAIYGSVGAPARWLQRAEALQQRVTAAK